MSHTAIPGLISAGAGHSKPQSMPFRPARYATDVGTLFSTWIRRGLGQLLMTRGSDQSRVENAIPMTATPSQYNL